MIIELGIEIVKIFVICLQRVFQRSGDGQPQPPRILRRRKKTLPGRRDEPGIECGYQGITAKARCGSFEAACSGGRFHGPTKWLCRKAGRTTPISRGALQGFASSVSRRRKGGRARGARGHRSPAPSEVRKHFGFAAGSLTGRPAGKGGRR